MEVLFMKNDILPEHTKEILTEMCRRVGVSYDSVDFNKQQWYQDHTWTAEEQDDFRKWLGGFLRKHKYVGKGKKRGVDWGYYEAGKLVGNYGWRLKNIE